MRAPQARQRPRSNRYETTGMLSRAATRVPQDMQAEAGRTIDRRMGTRAATTFRKLPRARPGKKAARASAIALPRELLWWVGLGVDLGASGHSGGGHDRREGLRGDVVGEDDLAGDHRAVGERVVPVLEIRGGIEGALELTAVRDVDRVAARDAPRRAGSVRDDPEQRRVRVPRGEVAGRSGDPAAELPVEVEGSGEVDHALADVAVQAVVAHRRAAVEVDRPVEGERLRRVVPGELAVRRRGGPDAARVVVVRRQILEWVVVVANVGAVRRR